VDDDATAGNGRSIRHYWLTAGLAAILAAAIAGAFGVAPNLFGPNRGGAAPEPSDRDPATPMRSATPTPTATPARTPTATPSPPRSTPGTDPGSAAGPRLVDLPRSYAVDVDTGSVTSFDPDDPGFDLASYSGELRTAAVWDSSSPVQMADAGTDPVDPASCASNTRFTSAVNISDLQVGSQFCLRTTEEQMLLITVAALPEDDGFLQIAAADTGVRDYAWSTSEHTLPRSYAVDVDTGAVTIFQADDPAFDLASYSGELRTAAVWDSGSAVQMADAGSDPYDPAGCASNTRFISAVNISDLQVGSQFCLRTTEEQMVLLTVAALPEDDGFLRLTQQPAG
jgi:hypothetical protein